MFEVHKRSTGSISYRKVLLYIRENWRCFIQVFQIRVKIAEILDKITNIVL